ncbi:O-antigen ligase family protein [Mesobacillus stamsii]|nr:O-antigen ligase family protein [Mesobacillus stamsii]
MSKSLSNTLLGVALVIMFTSNDKYFLIANTYILFLLTIISAIVGILLKKKKVVFTYENIYMICILYFVLVSCLVAWPNVDRGYALSYILLCLLYISINIRFISAKEIYSLISYYIISAIIISLMILIFRVDYFGGGGYRYTIQFRDNMKIDPNYLAAYLSIPTIFSLKRLILPKRGENKFFYVFCTIILCSGVFLTGSRAAMIATIVGCAFVYIDYLIIVRKKDRYFILKIAFSVILIFIIANIILYNLPDTIYQRFFVNSYVDGSNDSRIELWYNGLQTIKDHPLFGSGMMTLTDAISETTGHYATAHNTYISLWIQLGAGGFALFVLLLGRLIIKNIQNRNFTLVGVMFSLLFTSMIIGAEVSISFWITIIIITMINNYLDRDKEKTLQELI